MVCLCGSARFWQQFQASYVEKTVAGRAVLSTVTVPGGDDALFARHSAEERARLTDMLGALRRYITQIADEVLVLDVGGYIGSSTAQELAYAQTLGKRVRFLEDEPF